MLQVYTGIFNHNIGANLLSLSVYCHNIYFHRHCFITSYYVAEFIPKCNQETSFYYWWVI